MSIHNPATNSVPQSPDYRDNETGLPVDPPHTFPPISPADRALIESFLGLHDAFSSGLARMHGIGHSITPANMPRPSVGLPSASDEGVR